MVLHVEGERHADNISAEAMLRSRSTGLVFLQAMDMALGIFSVAFAVALYKRFRSNTHTCCDDRLDVVSGLSHIRVLFRVAEM